MRAIPKTFHLGKEIMQGIARNKKWKDESYPDVMKRLLESYEDQEIMAVTSGAWWELLQKIKTTNDRPIEIIGKPGNGKSHTLKELLKNDKENFYFIIDAHDEYRDLKAVKDLFDAIKKLKRWEKNTTLPNSFRFLPEETSRLTMQTLGVDAVSRNIKDQLFELKKKNRLPPINFILIVEEAARYKNLEFFGLESRKFCKTILVTSSPLYGQGDTLDKIKILKGKRKGVVSNEKTK